MFNRKKIFITITFANVIGCFDYPKHLPLPRINDDVHFNGKFRKVSEVKHMTYDTMTTISIYCSSLSQMNYVG